MRQLLIAVLFLAQPTLVWAQDTQQPAEDTGNRPWAKGVSQAKQDEAVALFEEGNGFFARESYAQAKAIYDRALKIWDHPSIRYNLSECLIHLDRPLEALANLEGSLVYGDAPLGPEIFKRAQTRKKLLEAQLAIINVSSEQAGVKVSLDGEELFVAPGKARRRVLPGTHQIVAEKPNFVTYSNKVIAVPHQPLDENIELKPVVIKKITFERRWATWVPWAVAGAGAAVAIAGGGLMAKGSADLDSFDKDVDERCPAGCPLDQVSDLIDDRDRAELTSTLGVSFLAVGSAALIGGAVLLFLNQPTELESGSGIKVGAAVTGDSVGFVFSGRL